MNNSVVKIAKNLHTKEIWAIGYNHDEDLRSHSGGVCILFNLNRHLANFCWSKTEVPIVLRHHLTVA